LRPDKNIFKTKDGRFGIDICRRYQGEDGRPKQKRIHYIVGTSIKEARDARDREQLKIGGKSYRFGQSNITFDVFAEKYLEQHSAHNRSCYCDRNSLKLHQTPFFGRHRLSDITTSMVLEYIARRRGEKSSRGTPTSPATINREIALVKSMLNRALEWEDITECLVNWRRIKKFDEYGRDRTLTDDEFSRLIEAAERVPHLRDFLLIALNTGMRKGEILGLRWEYIDFDGRTISVPRNLRKNRKPLIIPMNQTLIDIFSNIQRTGDFVFINGETGDRLKNLSRSFKTACRRAKKDPEDKKDPGIVGLRIHDLRHTFGTALAQAGEGTLAISKLLGHGSEAMTRRYINRMDERLQVSVDKLNGKFSAKRRYTDDTPLNETPVNDSVN
jgi:integrase